MASHFSSIGFPLNSQEELGSLLESLYGQSRPYPCQSGRYLRWVDSSGAELWLQLDSHDNLVGVNPHFSGKSQMKVRLEHKVHRPDSSPLDGAFLGWVDPSDDKSEPGSYPFVFDSPDSNLCDQVSMNSVVQVQIAAFAHSVEIFADPEEFESRNSGKFSMASQSFIPSGMFSPGGRATEPPTAHAVLTGHILEAQVKTNTHTRERFHWLLVQSFAAVFDVVIAPELMNVPPKPRAVISGSFWISGRIDL
jgi:hypothetical protein